MNLFKALFGRMGFIGLAIILQIILIVLFLFLLNDYFVYFQIFSFIIAILIFLKIINEPTNPDFKVPWLVIVISFPILGGVLYLMFSQNKLGRKQKRRYNLTEQKVNAFAQHNVEKQKHLEVELGEYAGQSEYLMRTSGLYAQENTDTKYFSLGEEFYVSLLTDLRQAKHFIFMEYFIIEEGKMWNSILSVLKEKVASGVEVRLCYDDLGCINKLPSNYAKQMNKLGIKCVKFNKFLPIATAVHNNRNHRKITVIDGVIGYTGGINLADEYINETHPFGHWKDTAIRFEGEAVKNLTLMFLQSYDAQAKIENEDYKRYIPNDFPKFENSGIVHIFGDGPKPLYQDYVGENMFINMISNAKRYIYISTPYLIIDYNILNALTVASKRGVDVRIILPHIPDKKIIFYITRSNYKILLEAGVKIYEYTPGFIHSKACVCDDIVGFVGTINLDYRSLVHHFECGAWLYKTPTISQIKLDFDKTLIDCEQETSQNFKQGLFARLCCQVLHIFNPLF